VQNSGKEGKEKMSKDKKNSNIRKGLYKAAAIGIPIVKSIKQFKGARTPQEYGMAGFQLGYTASRNLPYARIAGDAEDTYLSLKGQKKSKKEIAKGVAKSAGWSLAKHEVSKRVGDKVTVKTMKLGATPTTVNGMLGKMVGSLAVGSLAYKGSSTLLEKGKNKISARMRRKNARVSSSS
jgi:hypothetical protein